MKDIQRSHLREAKMSDYVFMYILAFVVGCGIGGFVGFRAVGEADMGSRHQDRESEKQFQTMLMCVSTVAGGIVGCGLLAGGLAADRRTRRAHEASMAQRAAARASKQAQYFNQFGPKDR